MSRVVRRAVLWLAAAALSGLLTPGPATAGKVPKACPAPISPTTSVPLSVTSSTSGITVSWTVPPVEVSRIRRWRIAAVDSAGGAASSPTWKTVKAGTSCGTARTSLTGLSSGHSYEVWLEVVTASSAWDGSTVNRLVGRTSGVAVG